METISLYDAVAPGSEEWRYPEIEEPATSSGGVGFVRNVTRPVLIPYWPTRQQANGMAVVVCPGGAFHGLAIYHEGHDVASWLQSRGVAAFVLKYRVLRTPQDPEQYAAEMQRIRSLPFEENERYVEEVTKDVRPMAVADGLQALRVVRQHAGQWGLRSDRIGVMGFSAGGYVAAQVAVGGLDQESRPDFAAVIYGALVNGLVVPADAPPLFLALTSRDEIAVDPCIDLYCRWRKAGRPAELHIYAEGGHGFGMMKQGLPVDGWIDQFWAWLVSSLR